MAAKHKTRRAREYLRVSLDKSGRERSQDEQHDDNAAAAKAAGLTLGRPYRENGSASASRYSGKVRGGWADLLDDLRRDRFAAEVLILWEHSRGSRRVGEWVDLIDLCETRSVEILVTTHGREYDPANARDRRSLLEDAVDSAYESDKVSMRAKRAAAANAAQGKPHGRAPYGYRRLYDSETRKLIAQEPYEPEAKVVRELYARLARGHSLRSIALDFEARGVVNGSGRPFTANHLRDLALRPCYAGLRVHHPRSNAEPDINPQRMSLEGAVTGTWPPLVALDTYHRVRRLLTRPERRTTRPGRARHLLSMIARCAECGSPLAATMRKQTGGKPLPPQYQCHQRGCVRVDKAELDDLATDAMLGWLSRDDVRDMVAAAAGDSDDLAAVRDDLAAVRAELAEAEAAVPETVAEARMFANLVDDKRTRVETLEARERELSAPSDLWRLLAPGRTVRRRWKPLPMSTKREVARMLLAPELLGELRVMRRPRDTGPVHVPAAERVEWQRSDGPQ